MRRSLTRCLLLALLATSLGCTNVVTKRRSVPYARINSVFTVEQQRQIDENVGASFGMPAKEWDFGRTDFVTRDGYVLEHSAVDLIPLWVAHHLLESEIDDPAPEGDRPGWRVEPQLPRSFRASDRLDYTGSGFDRGHMTPNADFDTREARDATFFLSNVVPQDPGNNQGIWAALEELVRSWVRLRGEAYVVTGGMFYEEAEDPALNVPGGDGVIEFSAIGDNQVAVPTHVFKVVLAPQASGSTTWEAISFVFENRDYDKVEDAWPFTEGLRSVDWIEQRTGLNLFPALDGNPIELDRIEAPTPTSLWTTR